MYFVIANLVIIAITIFNIIVVVITVCIIFLLFFLCPFCSLRPPEALATRGTT